MTLVERLRELDLRDMCICGEQDRRDSGAEKEPWPHSSSCPVSVRDAAAARIEELERSSLAYAERPTSDADRIAALEEAADEVVRTRYEPGSWGHEKALDELNKLLPKPYAADTAFGETSVKENET